MIRYLFRNVVILYSIYGLGYRNNNSLSKCTVPAIYLHKTTYQLPKSVNTMQYLKPVCL